MVDNKDPQIGNVLVPKPRGVPNQNKLIENKFAFVLSNLPGLVYFTQSIPIPAVSLSVVETDNPLNTINWPGTKISYSKSFSIVFSVDEDLKNYLGILRWMEGWGFPDDTRQHAEFAKDKPYNSLFAEARLLLANNAFNFHHEVVYQHCFPIDLGALQLDTTTQAANEMSCSVMFSYESFKIVPINSSPV